MQSGLKPQPLAYPMRYHRELLVDPLLWTSRHLDLAGCRFEPLESKENTQDVDDTCEAQNTEFGHRPTPIPPPPPSDPERLAKSSAPPCEALCPVPHSGKGPRFYFAGQAIHRPSYAVFGRRKQANQPLDDAFQTLIGYFDYTSATYGRKDKFQAQSHPGSGNKAPVGRLHQRRLAQITPANWEEDPHFVCILLSIAQLQERCLTIKKQATHTSRFLVAKWPDCEFIYLYEAQFTSELLEAIENPKAATAYTNWPTITRKMIPFKPFDTFRPRLVADLLLPGHRHCHNALRFKDGADVVKRTVKRQYEHEDKSRTVRRKACGN
ncbi:hypothetical protein BO70DRAFT_341766 [Aspergillus heteromorphus CBS 117.55]|uniref:Uncharacterized protein n=1 Tax=Aspergillus heteromorphus CBS 117.55 TaxID=1448321 RepID=A0A317VL97_9EURO|nr:uncharacterized protein BO70DRAFT_341766 [Aspergillus heteromorphus CBS 117.55]PWY73708.1 hypothetical protein BO70DRAFT_341766 [Aspergillus heteromorphus CBS 117.55]